ncbi:MAG: glycosyltransferase family 8 protein [Clostridia bacterium]|nr:glycosyltransferase family 8 protein [Clostridia bacterium]
MNVLYCGDGNIKDGLLISILSLIKNCPEKLNVYVLTAGISYGSTEYKALSEDYCNFLDEVVKRKNQESFIKLINITEIFKSCIPDANMNTRFTPMCMLRLYADLVEELPDKILYLDNDVICRLNPIKFYNMDMENIEMCGVLDYYGSWFFRNQPLKRDYLNSGVLLLNLPKIRQTGLFKKCRNRCRDTEMFMPDQSALNKLSVCKRIVSRKFNEQRKLHKDTVFQHFTTSFRFFPIIRTVSVKPWNIKGMHNILHLNEYDEILNEYSELKLQYSSKERAIL